MLPIGNGWSAIPTIKVIWFGSVSVQTNFQVWQYLAHEWLSSTNSLFHLKPTLLALSHKGICGSWKRPSGRRMAQPRMHQLLPQPANNREQP
jgi:hypothetical protein